MIGSFSLNSCSPTSAKRFNSFVVISFMALFTPFPGSGLLKRVKPEIAQKVTVRAQKEGVDREGLLRQRFDFGNHFAGWLLVPVQISFNPETKLTLERL